MTTAMLTQAQCTLQFEKCKGGFRIECCCDDAACCADLKALCESICDTCCSCCCTINGKQVCNIEICCDSCECKQIDNRCRITFTSKDNHCCQVLQKCCDCLEACCKAGCCCAISFGSTCVCCGTCA